MKIGEIEITPTITELREIAGIFDERFNGSQECNDFIDTIIDLYDSSEVPAHESEYASQGYFAGFLAGCEYYRRHTQKTLEAAK